MFAAPSAATGDWFVALGTRADCRVSGSATDGTPEQAARLARVLDALADGEQRHRAGRLAGAGHAARVAAQAQRGGDRPGAARHAAVADLAHRAERAAHRRRAAAAAPPAARARRRRARRRGPRARPRARGRADGAGRRSPTRPPTCARAVAPPTAPRAGLAVTRAVRRGVGAARSTPRITAIVAAGLAQRARERAAHAAAATPPACTPACAGCCRPMPPARSPSAAAPTLQLFAFDDGSGIDSSRVLRVQLRIGDRLGWLAATPELELRAVSADLTLPLDGSSPRQRAPRAARRARVRPVVGGARARQRRRRRAAGAARGARAARRRGAAPHRRPAAAPRRSRWRNLLAALGLIAANGGVVGDAVDQLVHDPAGLVRQRLASAGAQMLGGARRAARAAGREHRPAPRRPCACKAAAARRGRFGWQADLTRLAERRSSGQLRFGPDAALPTVGGLQLQLDLQPAARLAALAPQRRQQRRGHAVARTRRRRRSRACSRRPRPASARMSALEMHAACRRHGAPADRRRCSMRSACSPAWRATPSARCARSPA